MIHYQLRCEDSHEFDGWFNDSAGFDDQAARGLIVCPICAGTGISLALMAPAVAKRATEIRPSLAAIPFPPKPTTAGGIMPDAVRAALQKLRTEIEAHCDYVGPDFAEEARRIHFGEAEPRGIYGESTPEETEALTDEGIEFAQVPWVGKTDS